MIVKVVRGAWCVVAIMMIVGRLYAHTELVEAVPDFGETVEGSPAEVWLKFSEPLGAVNVIRVVDSDFRQVEGVVMVATGSAETITARLPTLEAGLYTVEYDVLSADGHMVQGSYQFAVAESNSSVSWLSGLAFGILFGLLFSLWRIRQRRLSLSTP